jgi:hypothetical protein
MHRTPLIGPGPEGPERNQIIFLATIQTTLVHPGKSPYAKAWNGHLRGAFDKTAQLSLEQVRLKILFEMRPHGTQKARGTVCDLGIFSTVRLPWFLLLILYKSLRVL